MKDHAALTWLEVIVVAALATNAIQYFWFSRHRIHQKLDDKEGWLITLLQCGCCLAYHLTFWIVFGLYLLIAHFPEWVRIPFWWLAATGLSHRVFCNLQPDKDLDLPIEED